MIVRIDSIVREGPNIVIYVRVRDDTRPAPVALTFDLATLQSQTVAQRRQSIVQAARVVLIQPPAPALGLAPGDDVDIGP